MTLGFKFGEWGRKHSSELNFAQWQEPGNVVREYSSDSESGHLGKYYSVNLDYLKDFREEGHRLTGHFSYGGRDMEEESTAEMFDTSGTLTSGTKSTEDGPGIRIRMKVDYTKPLNENAKFEAGLQSRLGISRDETTLSEYNTGTGTYDHLSQFDHKTDYNRDVHAIYTQYANEVGKLGFQTGLRGEYAYRKIETEDETQTFTIDRVDLFPTAHFSFQISPRNQLMTSYTRRIDRPRGWYLEPFETWTDAYNVRVGNPDLKPEYIDSYELGFQTFRKRNSFSAELFYRKVHNKIERIRSVYSETVTLHSTENVGTDYAMGAEFMLKFEPARWWNFNLTYSLFDYEVEGELNGVDYSHESSSWKAGMSNDFRIGESTRIQLSGRYSGPSVTSQGTESEHYSSSLAVRHDIIPKKLSATLSVRDVFGSSKSEHICEGENFYNYHLRQHKGANISLNVSYNFNNYERKRNGSRGDDIGEDDF